METIEIKNVYGKVIYKHTQEKNSIKITIEKAALEGANLEGSNLGGAALEGANLRVANLRGANLEDANLPIYSKWYVSYFLKEEKYFIKIGCKEKSISDWDNFFKSNQQYTTQRDTEDFKRIEANYLATKAYLTHLYPNNI